MIYRCTSQEISANGRYCAILSFYPHPSHFCDETADQHEINFMQYCFETDEKSYAAGIRVGVGERDNRSVPAASCPRVAVKGVQKDGMYVAYIFVRFRDIKFLNLCSDRVAKRLHAIRRNAWLLGNHDCHTCVSHLFERKFAWQTGSRFVWQTGSRTSRIKDTSLMIPQSM